MTVAQFETELLETNKLQLENIKLQLRNEARDETIAQQKQISKFVGHIKSLLVRIGRVEEEVAKNGQQIRRWDESAFDDELEISAGPSRAIVNHEGEEREMDGGARNQLNFDGQQKGRQIGDNEEENVHQNSWNASAYGKYFEISGPNNLIVRRRWNGRYARSVYAKNSISSAAFSSALFYFELTVEKMERRMSFGFAVKRNNGNFNRPLLYYSDGTVRIDGPLKGEIEGFGTGDTVGLGVILGTKQLFFTKNGCRIDSAKDLSISADHNVDQLFPVVSLANSGDKIEANFGPAQFEFDLTSISAE